MIHIVWGQVVNFQRSIIIKTSWVISQNWSNVLFLHFSCEKERIKKFLPDGLEIDTYNGEGYLSIVPFIMKDVRFPSLPPLPFASLWELNLRTYVKYKGRKGVYFFTLDTDHPLAQWIAKTFFNLPYRLRRMEGEIFSFNEKTKKFSFKSPDSFSVDALIGEKERYCERDAWLTERYSLFTPGSKGLYRGDVIHEPWKLRKVVRQAFCDDFTKQFGFSSPLKFIKASYSDGVNVFFKPFFLVS